MAWREQHHRAPRVASYVFATRTLTNTVALLLIVCLGVMSIQEFEQCGPPVGAIVVFKPGVASMDLWHVAVSPSETISSGPTRHVPTRACMLSPGAMARGGGSIVVEARRLSSPPIYRVHWAGMRTSDGADDCGKDAEIVLSRTDLQKLANSAGGFGVTGGATP